MAILPLPCSCSEDWLIGEGKRRNSVVTVVVHFHRNASVDGSQLALKG